MVVAMHAIRNPGDMINHGSRITRYGMIGDTYMTTDDVGDRAEMLWLHYRSSLFGEGLFSSIAMRLGLASEGVRDLEASMILASADITWSDICQMKS